MQPVYIEKEEAQKDLYRVINKSGIYHFCKRLFDIVASLMGLIIVSPIFLVVAVAIKIDDPDGPVFYSHLRAGKNGHAFRCYKFRSMNKDAEKEIQKLLPMNEMDGPVFKLKNDPRVTKVGKFIRKYSIDELPQLWNVLKADMSLIGPRPLHIEEAIACTPYQRQRELVRPGITCYWQVNGRNDVSFLDWVEMDLRYIKEQGFRTDIKILLRTIPAVLLSRGAY